MKTRSNRISAVQRRAKRRVILIAMGAAVFAGYSAVALFANDGKQDVVEELSKVPAVRAVGIRLMNPAGDKQEKKIELSLPPSMTASPTSVALPLPSPPSSPISLPPASPSQPASASPRNMELLAPPPRMLETVSKAAPGKVTVRLASNKKELPAENAMQVSTNSQKPSDSAIVNIHMTPVQSQDLTTKAPSSIPNTPQLNPSSLVEPPKVASKPESQPKSVRMKLDDSGLAELQTISPTAPSSTVLALPVPRPRNPELVKPQRFQISESVTLASAPNMDAPLTDEATADANGPTAEEHDKVTSSPVEIVVSTPKKTILDTPASSSVVGLSLPMVSLTAPPTDIESAESTNPSTGLKDQKSAEKPGLNYDSRWSQVSPVATIEMESQSATALEIPGNIRAVSVENEDVCRVLYTERAISIVGSKQGSSLIQVWTTELKDAPQVLRVNVSQPWQTPNANSGDLKEVKQALAQAFPRSNLKLLKQEDGTLEVRGTTENEETARRVLEMVRKLCLVPVKDKVTVLR